MPRPSSDFWKSTLAACPHDPPSKCVDIRHREEQARTFYRQAGFFEEDKTRRLSDACAKPSSWTASAADDISLLVGILSTPQPAFLK